MASTTQPLHALLDEIVKHIENNETSAAMSKIALNPLLMYVTDLHENKTLLAHAITKDDQALIDFLLRVMTRDVVTGRFLVSSIMYCVCSGTTKTLRKLVVKFPETINDYSLLLKESALFYAATVYKDHEKTEILLEAGANKHQLIDVSKNRTVFDVVKEITDENMIALFEKYSQQ